MDEITDIIIDMGKYKTIIGRANSSDSIDIIEPTICADTTIPLIKNPIGLNLSDIIKERFIGSQALRYKNVLKISYFLLQNDYLTFALLINNGLRRLEVKNSECGLILIVSSQLSDLEKQKIEQNLFKILKVKKIAFLLSSDCVLSALGLQSGVIIDIGYNSTYIESIFQNNSKSESKYMLPIAGRHLTQYYVDLLIARFHFDSAFPLYSVAEEIKNKHIQCVENYKDIIKKINRGSTEYDQLVKLPDNKELIINKECFLPAEFLFNPKRANINSYSLVELIDQSIRAWGNHDIKELCHNIIICGNGSKIPGLSQKITNLLKRRYLFSLKVNNISESELKTIFWKGAAKIYSNNNEKIEWKLKVRKY